MLAVSCFAAVTLSGDNKALRPRAFTNNAFAAPHVQQLRADGRTDGCADCGADRIADCGADCGADAHAHSHADAHAH